MSTLSDEWKKYRDAMYPQGTTPNQNQQLHMAFMAGALVAVELVSRPQDSDEKSIRAAMEIAKEVEQLSEFPEAAKKARN